MNLKSCTKHAAPKKITVPDLVGMTKEAALAALEKLKLGAQVIEKNVDGVAAGVVASQSPAAGSTATTQTVVTLTVSNGGVSNPAPTADFSVQANGQVRREGHCRRFGLHRRRQDHEVVLGVR